MADFTSTTIEFAVGACIHTGHPAVSTCNAAEFAVLNYVAATAPAANRAIYIPFCVDQPVTAMQMFWENGAANGTTDVGIYDGTSLARLVSLGPTTNAGTTIQVGNITDTTFGPGLFYMGWLPSTVTTQTYWSAAIAVPHLRCCGVTQQAVGSATLPNPAVFAAVASAYLPFMGISFQAVM
jgi:hypothetical protein